MCIVLRTSVSRSPRSCLAAVPELLGGAHTRREAVLHAQSSRPMAQRRTRYDQLMQESIPGRGDYTRRGDHSKSSALIDRFVSELLSVTAAVLRLVDEMSSSAAFHVARLASKKRNTPGASLEGGL